jgi:protein ImuB
MAEIPLGPPMRMTWRNISYRILKASGPERIEGEWWRSGKHLEFLLPPKKEEEKPLKEDDEKPHVTSLEPYRPSQVTRDYYMIEDEGGRRFWVFRMGLYSDDNIPVWYLHGFFA